LDEHDNIRDRVLADLRACVHHLPGGAAARDGRRRRAHLQRARRVHSNPYWDDGGSGWFTLE